ncbi:Uncharacterised protein [Legionella israelensis]|nr:hypothetical protein SAMN02746069_01841 [Legionella israelensis DSM 19235]STX58139.1 Uncharacterised protein [Legionella israelensis]
MYVVYTIHSFMVQVWAKYDFAQIYGFVAIAINRLFVLLLQVHVRYLALLAFFYDFVLIFDYVD